MYFESRLIPQSCILCSPRKHTHTHMHPAIQIKYFNDLWSFDLSTLKWETFGPSADSSLPMPSPRSAANIAVYENTLYLYGGYYRAEDEDDAEIERGRLFKDMWTISLDPRRGGEYEENIPPPPPPSMWKIRSIYRCRSPNKDANPITFITII